MASPSAGGKDLYKILHVSRTATKHEIKLAYRKLAMVLHPDKNDGCNEKADAFKAASDAYDTLGDHARRTAYDNQVEFEISREKLRNGMPPPINYRKVYAPQPPPGFKVFDRPKHFDMHYGDGMMKEEVEHARQRAQQASGRDKSHGYESPLGKGFTFAGDKRSADHANPYSKAPQGPQNSDGGGGFKIDYEQTHMFDSDGTLDDAKRVIQHKESVVQRMHERRQHRVNRKQQHGQAEGCSII